MAQCHIELNLQTHTFREAIKKQVKVGLCPKVGDPHPPRPVYNTLTDMQNVKKFTQSIHIYHVDITLG